MTEDSKQQIEKAMKDIYYELNHSVNHLIILREFFKDLLNIPNKQ